MSCFQELYEIVNWNVILQSTKTALVLQLNGTVGRL